jgi:WD40 repeat protein
VGGKPLLTRRGLTRSVVALAPDAARLLRIDDPVDVLKVRAFPAGATATASLASPDGTFDSGLGHGGRVRAGVFRPDGAVLLTASDDRTARLWDAATGKEVAPPLPHQAGVLDAAFQPDGPLVLTGSADRTAQLWDAATGRPHGPPMPHPDAVTAVGFGPDGRTVLTTCADGAVRLWDAATARPLGPPRPHGGPVLSWAFRPDGRAVLTGSADRTARVWSLTEPVAGEIERLVLAVQFLTQRELDASGVVRELDEDAWEERRARLAESGGLAW